MARRKKSDEKTAAINFRCPIEIKTSLEDLAHLSRQDVSSLLVELCKSFIDANRTRITKFRQQAATPIKMPTFDTVKKKAIVETPSDESAGVDNGEE